MYKTLLCTIFCMSLWMPLLGMYPGMPMSNSAPDTSVQDTSSQDASLSSSAHSLYETIVKAYTTARTRLTSVVQTIANRPLFNAAQAPYDEVVALQMALGAGAELQAINKDGLTALHLAALHGNYKIVKELERLNATIDAHVPADAKKYAGMTPLMLAISKAPSNATQRFLEESPYTRIIFSLLKHGASLTATDASGRNALFWAQGKHALHKELTDLQEQRTITEKMNREMQLIEPDTHNTKQ